MGKIEGLLLDCLECLLQIGDQVVGILGTDGQADGVLVDALVQQFLLAELAVGGGGRWMTRLLTSATLASRLKIFRWSMNAWSFLHTALDLESEDGAPPLGKYFWYSA